MSHKPYPSDLTDDQWAALEPLVPPARPGGRPRKHPMRAVLNALFYHAREGCTWRALPHDFPPWRTVYNYFRWFGWDGTWERLVDELRERVRVRAGREPTPSAAAIDSQSVKTAEGGAERGTDGGKRVNGRKRHVAVGAVSWPGKATVTFSDALCAVRRWLWAEAILPQAGDGTALQKLPEPIRELLLTTLAPAA